MYALLKIQIERFGLRHRFRILDNKIINRFTGSEFMFYGLWRHVDEIVAGKHRCALERRGARDDRGSMGNSGANDP